MLWKKTKHSKLNSKITGFEAKTPDASTLIHINQYQTDKQSLEKDDVDKRYLTLMS